MFANQIIMNGDLYYAVPSATAASSGVYRIVDLRTGQILNELAPTVAPGPSFGIYQDVDSENQHGATPVDGVQFFDNGTQSTYNINSTFVGFQNGTQWIGYRPGHPDGQGGSPLVQYEILDDVPTFGAAIMGIDGPNMYAYVFNNITRTNPQITNNWQVRIWNSSKATTETSTGTINASGTTQTSRLQLNVPINYVYGGQQIVLQPDTVAVAATYVMSTYTYTPITNAILLCRNGTLPIQGSNATGAAAQYTYFAISLSNQTIQGHDYTEGQLMWIKTYSWPTDDSTLIQGPAADGVYTMVSPQTGIWMGFDMVSGTLLWTSTPEGHPYTPGNAATGSTASIAALNYAVSGSYTYSQHHNLYVTNNGVLYCYDLFDGHGWTYSAPVGYSAYTNNYPLNIGAIADDKIYLGSYVDAGQSLLSGSLVRCLNATDGSLIWTIPSWGGSGGFAVSDGYMTYLNYYDLQVYTVGKGPSAITVGVANGVSDASKVTVTGTVTDQSPGSAIKGTAAISDKDMGAWMAYKFMNQARPANAAGVDVTISVIDPNGNPKVVGTGTSNSDGTYSIDFVPEISGTYQLIATFTGTNSYYPSSAHSTVYVNAPVQPTAAPTATPAPVTDSYILGSTAAIIIAVALAGVVLAILLRRKP
jgi:hypothetical protein